MDENNLPKELSEFIKSDYFKENIKILNEKVARGELDKNKTFAISLNPNDMVNKIPGTNFIEVTGSFQLPMLGPRGITETNQPKICISKSSNTPEDDFSKIKPLFRNI